MLTSGLLPTEVFGTSAGPVSEEAGPVLEEATPDVGQLVSQLSWESVGYDHFALALVPKATGPIADRLVAIGRPATAPLLEALVDPNRGVAAHLVLCAIYHPGEIDGGEATIWGDHGHLTGSTFSSFGLSWREHIAYQEEPTAAESLDLEELAELYRHATYTYSVTETALAENLGRWCRELPDEYLDACRGRYVAD